jgi:thiamine-phosphate pyrophosphorylase
LIQIRERDLPARELLTVAEEAARQAQETSTRVLVNDRLDIALAAGTAGVHLPVQSLPLTELRKRYPEVLVGASTHNLVELQRAADVGADFAVFGPVFPPLSKSTSTAPVGLEALVQAVLAVEIPVLALGGITEENARACLEAGAAGLAGITLFQQSKNLTEMVNRLRNT